MIYTYLATALLSALLAFGGAWKVQDWRFGAKEKERLEAIERTRRFDEKRIDVAATGHEADKRDIQTKFVTITEEVERIVREPFYVNSEQCLDDAGLRSLRDAIAPIPADSEKK